MKHKPMTPEEELDYWKTECLFARQMNNRLHDQHARLIRVIEYEQKCWRETVDTNNDLRDSLRRLKYKIKRQGKTK